MFAFRQILILGLGLLFINCTVFRISKDGKTMIGSNEDWPEINAVPLSWVIPRHDDRFAAIYFGYDVHFGWAQSGMNEHGLFYDGAESPAKKIKHDPDKFYFEGNIFELILERCSTVRQAVDTFQAYNWGGPLIASHFMLADRTGTSVIIEWERGEPVFIFNDAEYDIMTNFDVCKKKDPDCWRYQEAERLINECSNEYHDLWAISSNLLQQNNINSCITKIYNLNSLEVIIRENEHDSIINVIDFGKMSKDSCFVQWYRPVRLEEELADSGFMDMDTFFFNSKQQHCLPKDAKTYVFLNSSNERFTWRYNENDHDRLWARTVPDMDPCYYFSVQHGVYWQLHKNGSIYVKGNFAYNKKHGKWHFYDRRENLEKTVIYEHGVILKTIHHL